MNHADKHVSRIHEITGQDYFKEFYNIYKDENTTRVLLFIGSGPSIGVGYPTWKNLLIDISARAKSKFRGFTLGEEFEKKLDEKLYVEAGSILRSAINAPLLNTPSTGKSKTREKKHTDWWRELLDEIFKSKNLEASIHDVIVKLKWDKIITTNYDCLIEDACDHQGISNRVFHPWTRNLQGSQHINEKVIFKIHGHISDKASKILLTKEEYDELYLRPQGLDFRKTLESHLGAAHVIIFIGYSHDDRYFREWFAEVCDNKESIPPTYAFFPSPESNDPEFDEKIEKLRLDVGIRPITFSHRHKFAELREILEHLRDLKDDSGPIQILARQPTVILLYTGGTIGSVKNPGELHKEDVLSLRKIPSRFDPGLENFSQLLRNKFRQFYHRGKDFKFDLIWEILPEDQQILSENATVDHWNNLLKKIDDILHKYVQSPASLTGNDFGSNRRLLDMYDEEVKEFAKQKENIKTKEDSEAFSRRYPEDLTKSVFLKEIKHRYIAGIIILHGTDTMSSTAATLAFGMRNLPVPIIMTGANRPPDEDKIEEKSEIYWESDTWKNLVTSLYFLQCFGHRFTEVFICFGDTIHHALNLRKTAMETVPLKRGVVQRHSSEPFAFRNYSVYKQYLFRLIDDIFCNNYYPSRLPFNQLILPELAYLRHVRQNPFPPPGPVLETVFSTFSPAVNLLAVSPTFPPIDVRAMLKDKTFRAVLIEGYKSGTYPSKPKSPFALFMSKLEEEGIPIILVSHYGIPASLEIYETHEESIPVIRLFGVIAETALPMLNLVVSRFTNKEWGPRKGAESAQHRRDLITAAIKRLFDETSDETKNIISIEFGSITDQTVRREHLDKTIREELDLDTKRPVPFEDYSSIEAAKLRPSNRRHGSTAAPAASNAAEIQIDIPRADFLWYLDEVVRPFERIGAGPDGFSILADMGFEWGFHKFHNYQQAHERRIVDTPFHNDKDKQRKLIDKANNMLRKVAIAITNSGVANIHDPNSISISYHNGSEAHEHSRRQSFSFEVTIYRGKEFIRSDEKFNAQTYSENEEEFFTLLEAPPEFPEGQKHFERLSEKYVELMRTTWQHKTTSLDWFILGVFRGVACAIACYFLFDMWSIDIETNDDPPHLRALRQSVKCKIIRSKKDVLRFTMTYYAWNQSERTRRDSINNASST